MLLTLPRDLLMKASKINLSFVVIVLAFPTNIMFGAFRLINLVNVRFLYFYSPKVINIIIVSPAIDSYVWFGSLLATVLTPIIITRMKQSNFPNWWLWPNLAALASLPILFINETAATLITAPLGFLTIATTSYYGFGEPRKRLQTINWTFICIAATIGIIETLSLSTWVWNAYNYEIPFSTPIRWKFSWIDLQLFNLSYPWTAWLFVILLYSWIWIPVGRYVYSRLHIANKSLPSTLFSKAPEKEGKLKTKTIVLSLVAIVAIAVLVTSYAYIHSQGMSVVGTDAPLYYQWLSQVDKDGLSNVFQTDRPLTLLITYTIRLFTTLSSLDTIRILPIICAASLSLAVFWFVRTGTRNDQLALTSALISVFAFQTTVGIYAYFLANWFAIILSFLLLTCMLKSLQTQEWRYTLLASFVGMTMILTHSYTWILTLALIMVYAGIIFVQTLRKRTAEKQDIKKLVSLIASNTLFYAIYTLLPFGSNVGASASVITSSLSLSLLAPTNVYNGINSAIELWVGGLFANPLLLILAVAGMFALDPKKSKFDRFLIIWIAVPSIILFTLSPENFETFVFHRILYLLPVQILAAIGLHKLLNKMDTLGDQQRHKSTTILKILITLMVLLFLINYALRAVEGAPLKIV
jgi:hypothetical protein